MLPKRKKETVVKFFASIPTNLHQTIERVCTDMYLEFVNAAPEQLPHAHIIIDRFDVARAYCHCADRVRRVELKLLKQNLSKKESTQLKGAMRVSRKSLGQLNDSEWELLQRLFIYSTKMKEAYILREELTSDPARRQAQGTREFDGDIYGNRTPREPNARFVPGVNECAPAKLPPV